MVTEAQKPYAMRVLPRGNWQSESGELVKPEVLHFLPRPKTTDGLTRLFSTDLPPVRLMRDLGFFLFNKARPLKRVAMRHAMGIVGDLPRLVKGEKL